MSHISLTEDQRICDWYDSQTEETLRDLQDRFDAQTPRQAFHAFFPDFAPSADQCPGDGLDAPAEAQQGAHPASSDAEFGLSVLDLQVLDVLENDFDAFFEYLTTPHPAAEVAQAVGDLYPGARLV